MPLCDRKTLSTRATEQVLLVEGNLNSRVVSLLLDSEELVLQLSRVVFHVVDVFLQRLVVIFAGVQLRLQVAHLRKGKRWYVDCIFRCAIYAKEDSYTLECGSNATWRGEGFLKVLRKVVYRRMKVSPSPGF